MEIKVGDIVKIYSEKHWDIPNRTVNNVKFLSGLIGNDKVSDDHYNMYEQFGQILEVTKVTEFNEVMLSLPGQCHTWKWDYSAIEKVIVKEDNPEYFL